MKHDSVLSKLNWGWQQVLTVVALLGIGIPLFYFCKVGILHSIGEALFIAGLLAFAVDPILKRRIQKDTANDIFHHLIGFDLPLAIREDLKEFVESNHCYRENLVIRCEAQVLEGKVSLTVELSGQIVAAKNNAKYKPHLAFEESFCPTVLKFSVSPVSKTRKIDLPNVELTESKTEPMVKEWSAPAITLDRGEKLDQVIRYKIEGGLSDFYVIFFGLPAIEPHVELIPNSSLQMTASHTQRSPDGSYLYDKVFRRADHIQIRWRPRKPDTPQQPSHC